MTPVLLSVPISQALNCVEGGAVLFIYLTHLNLSISGGRKVEGDKQEQLGLPGDFERVGRDRDAQHMEAS